MKIGLLVRVCVLCVCVCVCVCVSGNACGYLILHPWEELHLYVMDMGMGHLFPPPPPPPPPPTHKLEILDPSLKLNILSCQDQLNRMPLQ